MADKVSDLQQRPEQIERLSLVLKVFWWLLPKHHRSELWWNFHDSHKSPRQIIRETVKDIKGIIRAQTTERYYPGMAVVQTLTISASLLATMTLFEAGVVAGAVSTGLLVRDGYMNPKKRGYAAFLWDSVTAIALLAVLQILFALRSSEPLLSAIPWIAAQSIAGGASGSFFRLIFKMPPNPLDRVLEDYWIIFYINLVWFAACLATMYIASQAVAVETTGIVFFLNLAPPVVACMLLRLQSDSLGGTLAEPLLSLLKHPVQQQADRAKARLVVLPETLQRRCLEIGFFALMTAPFAIALWKWWTKQDSGIHWLKLSVNAGELLILAMFWVSLRQVNAETVKAIQEKIKEELKREELRRLEKPPEKTDDNI